MADESAPRTEWTEDDSRLYRELAAVAVPARDEQIATLLSLLGFDHAEPFRVVELGSGEGALSFAILDCYPHATVLGLDGSASMRTRAGHTLDRFGSRFESRPFDLVSADWRQGLDTADCVVSSLCVHHLSGADKRKLFADVGRRTSARGRLLLADIVQPQRPEARTLFGDGWDRVTRAQSVEKTGTPRLFDRFREERWNYFHTPDPYDTPSPLFDQLTWLKAAGFAVADCFWLHCGHAIYGGYKSPADRGESVPFANALRSARAGLRAVEQANG